MASPLPEDRIKVTDAELSGRRFGCDVQGQEGVHFSALGEHTAFSMQQGSTIRWH